MISSAAARKSGFHGDKPNDEISKSGAEKMARRACKWVKGVPE
jgi:hypothetical protein